MYKDGQKLIYIDSDIKGTTVKHGDIFLYVSISVYKGFLTLVHARTGMMLDIYADYVIPLIEQP